MTGQQLDWSGYGRCPATVKARIETVAGAEKLARRCRRIFGRVMRHYRCPTCRAYHLSRKHKSVKN